MLYDHYTVKPFCICTGRGVSRYNKCMKDHYHCFVFDLYGTLVDIRTDESLPRLWSGASRWLEAKGISYAPDELRERYAEHCREAVKRKEAELADRGIPGPAEIEIMDIWDALAGEKGVTLNETEKIEFSQLFRRLSTCRLRLFPGADEVLKTLRDAGKTVCLLTNAQSSFTLPELEDLGIDRAFDHIFVSSRFGVKKPSPAFFEALQSVGTGAGNMLMIGNDDICDCRGAAAAGIDSLYIRTEQSPEPTLPLPRNCREIRTLGEIVEFAGKRQRSYLSSFTGE